jgi:peroxiredoxin Q/BCP
MQFNANRASKLAGSLLALVISAGFSAINMNVARAGEIPKVGEVAADFTLETPSGKKVHLTDATAKGPVVLVVLRGYPGYQCPICTVQVNELIGKAKTLEERNARVILVYPGPAEGLKAHSEEFLGSKALPDNFNLVLDPDYRFTKAYGLRWDAPKETAYPSTLVLDTDQKVLFAKVSKTHGGRAKAGEILESLPKK